MGDARSRSGRGESRIGRGGGEGQRPRSRYDEHWLEHMVRGLYESAVNEPLPERLLDIVRRIPDADQTRSGARMPAQNVPRVRENIGVLHHLLNFQESETKGRRITKALEGGRPIKGTGAGRGTLDLSERARVWRLKAEECRIAAESMSGESAGRSLLQLASDYETWAEDTEKEAQRRGAKKRGAG